MVHTRIPAGLRILLPRNSRGVGHPFNLSPLISSGSQYKLVNRSINRPPVRVYHRTERTCPAWTDSRPSYSAFYADPSSRILLVSHFGSFSRLHSVCLPQSGIWRKGLSYAATLRFGFRFACGRNPMSARVKRSALAGANVTRTDVPTTATARCVLYASLSVCPRHVLCLRCVWQVSKRCFMHSCAWDSPMLLLKAPKIYSRTLQTRFLAKVLARSVIGAILCACQNIARNQNETAYGVDFAMAHCRAYGMDAVPYCSAPRVPRSL